MDFQQFRDFQLKNYIFTNAFTSGHQMGVDASGHSSDFEVLYQILLEMAYKPAFDQSILTQEKEIVLREISERSGAPSYILDVWQKAQIFTEGSASNHQTLGLSEEVATTSFEDLVRLHNFQIDRSQTVIYACGGGFETQKVKDMTLEILNNSKYDLGGLSKSDTKLPINHKIKNQYLDFEHLNLVHHLAHEHCDVAISIPNPATLENAPLHQIFSELFLSFNGELYDLLRNKHGLVYSMSAGFYHYVDGGVFEIDLTTEKTKVEETFKVIKDFFSDFDKVFDHSKFEAL